MKSVITAHILATAEAAFLSTLTLASLASAKPAVEVAFLLDTTGSMGALIDGAKQKIWSIATTIADSNLDADVRMGPRRLSRHRRRLCDLHVRPPPTSRISMQICSN